MPRGAPTPEHCTRCRALRGEDMTGARGWMCVGCRDVVARLHVNSMRHNRTVWAGQPCAHCGAPASGLDHIIPFSLGGTDDRANLQPLCNRCNGKKGARLQPAT